MDQLKESMDTVRSARVADSGEYVARTHECPECCDRSRLVVAWRGGKEQVWCPRCGRTEAFRRKESLMAQWRRAPESVPVQIANIFERKVGSQPMSEQAIVQATETAMIKRIESARWLVELKPQDRQSLAHLAVKYGLDPLMKELTLYEGAPYISIAGLIRIAHRQKMFAGLEDRPMTQHERAAYGYKAPFCWIALAYRKDWKCAATGTGTANPESPFRNNPIERTRPEWMARSRAIRQALKLAFPQSLPFEEMETAEERGIDPETGEILDGQAVDVPGIIHDAEGIPHITADQAGTTQDAAEIEAYLDFAQPAVPNGPICNDCQQPIAEHASSKGKVYSPTDIAEMTRNGYGDELCWDCGMRRKQAKAQPGAGE